MKSISLNIAGYGIRVITHEMTDLYVEPRFRHFICEGGNEDISIEIHVGKYGLDKEYVKVFEAPYVEEINGVKSTKNDEFWSIWKGNDSVCIKAVSPFCSDYSSSVLVIPENGRQWHLWYAGCESMPPVFQYPLDGLVIYYLTMTYGGLLVHGSGVRYREHGFAFCGVSGQGKSTMANLWEKAGAEVIHDDRLIIRCVDNRYRMFNTPVYCDEKPKEAPLDKLFLIEHGIENTMIRLSGVGAVSSILSNCIQHNWNPAAVSSILSSVVNVCSTIPVYLLTFKPDKNIVNYLLDEC